MRCSNDNNEDYMVEEIKSLIKRKYNVDENYQIDENYGNYDDYVPPKEDKQNNLKYQNVNSTNINKNNINKIIVPVGNDSKGDQEKCPMCGATDILLNKKNNMFRCNYCRYEFEPEKAEGFVEDILNLTGEVIGSGATDIQEDYSNMVTLKCSSCGAEITIDTDEAMHARCHWCRNILSLNRQIPNGSVPDIVLPFLVTKKEAKKAIEKFVNERKFYAKTRFKNEFKSNNVMGVYLPYMIIDINGHAYFEGVGERTIRQYSVGTGKYKRERFDVDVFKVEREFDVTINGLSIESSDDKLDYESTSRTNNIINTIMPFDIENAVKWNASYLKGYTLEKRDVNIDDLRPIINEQSEQLYRRVAKKLSFFYNRGVRWEVEKIDIKGQQWKAAYFPVWIYSYYEKNLGGNKLHYIAVNARTKEIMGSIPINKIKVACVSVIVAFIMFFLTMEEYGNFCHVIAAIVGLLHFFGACEVYRNKDKRHTYEKETKTNVENLRKVDEYIEHKQGMKNARIKGENSLENKIDVNRIEINHIE